MKKTNIMLFKEWKDSNDYLIQEWFVDKKQQITKWFESGELEGYQINGWSQSSNDLYSIYTAELAFFDPSFQFQWTFILDSNKVVEGKIDQWQIETRTFAVDDIAGDELKKTVVDITIDQWSIDTFIEIITNSIND